MGFYFSAHSVSRGIRGLYLAARRVERLAISVGENWLYTFQRYTGLIAFVYIGWHVYTQRWLTHGMSTYAEMAQQLMNPWALAFMIVGIVASSFHLGVGVWNFLCKWGLAATARAQRAAGQLGVVVGVVFSCVGVLIVLSFRFDWHPFASYLTQK